MTSMSVIHLAKVVKAELFFSYKFDKYTLYKLTQILCKKPTKYQDDLKQYIK